ncbi:MAG: toll/interleukin-1 receptor domain-containing protein [Acidobacteriota bacterium]
MSPARWFAAVAVVGLIACALWPLPPALSSSDAVLARVICAALTAVACAALGLARGGRSLVWLSLSIATGAGGVATLAAHFNASSRCVASYDGRPTVIGRVYTPAGLEYVQANPPTSTSVLLLDAGGEPSLFWTPESIQSCRFWLSWGVLLAVPLFAACVSGAIGGRQFRLRAPARVPAPRIPDRGREDGVRQPVYDAFLSYRHTEPDTAHASELLEALESRALRVAIDIRDFAPNEHFLSEMERCIKESRFVLCVVTPRYVDSDHCSEEAIISKTLDLADRRKRLVPLIFERVELPIWLHGLVGIDFTGSARIDPLERLIALVARPVSARTRSDRAALSGER